MGLKYERKHLWKTEGAIKHILLNTLPQHPCRVCGGLKSLMDIPAYLPVDPDAEEVDMTLGFVCAQCRTMEPVQLRDLEQIILGIARNKRCAGTRDVTESEDQQLIEFLGYYYKRLQRKMGIPDLRVIPGGKYLRARSSDSHQ